MSVTDYVQPVLHLGAATFITSVLLMVLAWRGRRQSLSDGIAIMTVLVLAVAGLMSIAAPVFSPQYPDSAPLFYLWLSVSIYLACLIPAYLISYLALCRTPLLQGLAPLPKSKGPAEASP